MSKNLVIVESPAKASTISKYLGKDFDVLASYGHVRDLVPKEGAVDTENDFTMKYQIIERNEKHVNAIVRALKKADSLYLATDPDREGEAISWHLVELLKEKDVLKDKKVHRVIFHEITKQAVKDSGGQHASQHMAFIAGRTAAPCLKSDVMVCSRKTPDGVPMVIADPDPFHPRPGHGRDRNPVSSARSRHRGHRARQARCQSWTLPLASACAPPGPATPR